MPDLAAGLIAATPEVKAISIPARNARASSSIPPDHVAAGRVAGSGAVALF